MKLPCHRLHEHSACAHSLMLGKQQQNSCNALCCYNLAALATMLVQEPAQPEGVLKATIAALPKEWHHCMGCIPNEHNLALHCPCRRPHSSKDSCRILGNLPDNGVHSTSVLNSVLVMLLHEGFTFLSAFG